jgi:predicted metal-dependent hydrolase
MKQPLKHDKFTVFHLYKPRQKHSYISIESDGTVLLKSPIKNSNILLNIINERALWIQKQLEKVKQHKEPELGESLIYLGASYLLDDAVALPLNESLKRLRVRSPQHIQKCYRTFYKRCAQDYIPSRVDYFSKLMRLYPNNITFRAMKRRWGSCDSKKNLVFNSSIMKLKPEYIDYIIVHELAHIRHMNHSGAFHNLVAEFLPHAQSVKKELRYFRP